MKLSRKLLVGTLIISMVALSGCGKGKNEAAKETPAETVAATETPATTEEAETPKVSPSESPEATKEVEAPKDKEETTETDSEEPPISAPEYANLTDLEGDCYRTKLPEGWVEDKDASKDTYKVVTNDKLKSEILVSEQALEGADTIDMDAYMADHKKAYNEKSESTGVYVLDAGGKELDAVKVGYMKCQIKITEQMVKNAITKGSVTQKEVDAAGGMQKYIATQNTTQLQIYVPNKGRMITISAKVEGDKASEVEDAAYALANIMYLK